MNEDTYNIASATSSSGENLIIPIKWDFESVNVLKVVAVANGNAEILNSGYSWNDTLKQLEVQNNYGYEQWSVYVMREEDAQNVLQLISTSEVNAQNIVEQFNRTNRVVQQIQVNQRASICVPDKVNGLLPDVNARKGKFISFDDYGNPVANVAVQTLAENRARAVIAQTKAEAAQRSAEAAKAIAKTSESNAKTSESNAKGYAESASKSAESAFSSATMASNSSNIASNSADVARECKSEAEKYAQVAKSSANLTGAYANTTTEMLTGEHAISKLRFKTESGEQIVVKAEIVNGVPMLVPTIASDVLDDAFSVLQWKTASGDKFVVFAEIINDVPMLSCKIKG